ncbi:acetylornithine transaminase [Lysinibacter cavernae]|uniref:Acetylornithine aminotransferase n=1 Tax=Lysinibacter cavernae TaxID=1640652 RepID=A0A7X5R0Y7_9MICO|nr:acetylornithine aminotransferase [Lysinibacter cavernae]
MSSAPSSPSTWQSEYQHSLVNTFGIPKELLVRGEGCHVWNEEGKRYLDFLAGIAVNSLGHAHPAVVEAAATQAATLIHVSNIFASRPQIELAEHIIRLSEIGETGRVFFGNSGTEANEAAFKLARLHGGPGRPRILALENAFHGRTMGALALTGKPAMRIPFEPMPAGVEHIPATIEALEHALSGINGDQVAALIVEPIQGETGVHPLPDGYLKRARELTTAAGALLIIDEIQTGIGRTGKWLAFQHEGIVPDAFTLAKGLGGGVPIGALVTVGEASQLFAPGLHGSTFGGNPFATAVAGAVLSEIESEGLVDAATKRGEQLRVGILSLNSDLVEGVRGKGLLLGIALGSPISAAVAQACLERGLIVNAPNDSTIRLAPPLIIGDSEIEEFLSIFAEALSSAHS